MLKVKRHFQAVSSVFFFTFSTSYRTLLSPEGRVQKKYIKSLVFYQIVKYFSKIICHRYIKSVKPQNIKDFHWGFPAAMVLSYESCVYFIYLNVQSIEMFKIDAFFEAKYWIQHWREENITFYTNLHFYHEDFQHSLIKTVGVRYVPKNNNCKNMLLIG